MARSIKYVVELTREEAQNFLDDILNPKPNPTRDATVKRAMEMKIEVRK